MKKLAALGFLLIMVVAIAGLALAEEEAAAFEIASATTYQDGFIVHYQGWDEPTALDAAVLTYVALETGEDAATALLEVDRIQTAALYLLSLEDGAVVAPGLSLENRNYALFLAIHRGEDEVLSSAPFVAYTVEEALPDTLESAAFPFPEITLFEGDTLQVPLTLLPLGVGSGEFTFTSKQQKIATIDESGVITALSKGTAPITLEYVNNDGKKITRQGKVKVLRAVSEIAVNYEEHVLPLGKKVTLKATVSPKDASNIKVTFASSDESIAKVNDNGVITPVAPGDCLITVASVTNPAIAAQCKLTVVNPIKKLTIDAGNATLFVGDTLALSVAYAPDDASMKAVSYASSSTKIATVDENGVVTGVEKGTATITATALDGSGVKATARVTVMQQPTTISIDANDALFYIGEARKLTAQVEPKNANDKTLVWASSDESIATVDSNGLVTPVGISDTDTMGSAVITVTSKAYPATKLEFPILVFIPVTQIEMSESSISPMVETTHQLSYTVYPDDATLPLAKWSSSNESIATVDENGLVTAVSGGKAVISATSMDGKNVKGSTTVQVIQPVTGIKLRENEIRVGAGSLGYLHAEMVPSNATNTKVRWSSSDTSIATVSGDGLTGTVQALRWGKVTITAKSEDGGFTAKATVLCGDYDRAVVLTSLFLSKGSNGYRPTLQLRNDSNMTLSKVTITLLGYDINGNLLAIETNGRKAELRITYDATLAPGASADAGKFNIPSSADFTGVERIRACIISYDTSDGVHHSLPIGRERWLSYVTDDYSSANP